MITEEINPAPINIRTIIIPNANNSAPNINLAEVVQNKINNCEDCGNTMTGTECIDCAKQTIL